MFSSAFQHHYKKTFLLAYPVCISQLGHILVGAADTAMVGMIGTIEQAAVSLANGLYAMILVFGIGVSFGITPLVAEAHSVKDKVKIGDLLSHGLLVNFLTGLLLFCILYISSSFLNELDQPKDVVAIAIPFMNVMIFSMIPLSIFMTLKQFAEGLSKTKVAMIISLAANVLNIFLNYVMMFGKLGFPEMGVMGACWATFISRVIMAAAMAVYVFWNRNFKQYYEQISFRRYSTALIKKILDIGIPAGLQFSFEVGAFAFAAVMVGWLGARELAAHQIALSIAAITYMVASGIGAASTVRVGNYFGLRSRKQIRLAGFSSIYLVITFMSLSALALITFKGYLPHMFNKDLDVVSIASSLLIIAAFFQLSDGVQVVALGALRGIKDVKIPTAITLFAYWVIALPCSYFLAFKMELGANGVWYGLMIGLTIAAIMLWLRFNFITSKINFSRIPA